MEKPTTNAKVRKNITMPEATFLRGRELARMDGHNFSNFLTWLVDVEHERRLAARWPSPAQATQEAR
jgi:hypothetical protein